MAEPAASTAYMGQEALSYDENRFATPGGRRVHQIEHRNLQYALRQIDPAGRVLEVGCGTGRLLMEARADGYHVDGLDASPDMIELVKRKIDDKCADLQLYVAEAAQLPIDDDTYDLTYSVRMLNQTESPDYAKRAIAEMVRVTKPGGLVLFEFINVFRPRFGPGKRRTTRLKPAEAIVAGTAVGANLLRCYGAMALGISMYRRVPAVLIPVVYLLDRPLTLLLPRLCARVYVLMRKADGI